jgi:hypothetical protein
MASKKQTKKKVPKKVLGSNAKKQKKPQAAGLRNLLAKFFPTFAKALSIKSVDNNKNNNAKKKLKALTPMTPTVNLLPEVYTIVRAISNIRRGTTIVGLGVVVALGIIFYVQGNVINIAEGAKKSVDSQVREATMKVDSFKQTTDLYGLLNERKSVALSLEDSAPAYYEALSTIYGSLPEGASITNIQIQYITVAVSSFEGTPTGLLCGPIADPITPETRRVSACISAQGLAPGRSSIPELSANLESSSLFSNISVNQSSAETEGVVSFTISAGLLRDIPPGSITLPIEPDIAADPTGDSGLEQDAEAISPNNINDTGGN